MAAPVASTRLLHIDGGRREWRSDRLATEEPLEIRVDGAPVAVTMRTPGADFELAAGFLLGEGVIDDPRQLLAIRTCEVRDSPGNAVDAQLAAGAPGIREDRRRQGYVASSCGICGRASIAAVQVRRPVDVGDDPMRVTTALLASLPARLRDAQRLFSRTGGLHAAALFDGRGELACLREDVGRHNAFDKVVGWAMSQGRLPLRGHVILASGRASFELTQKALIAGIPVLAAVSAPSSLAVDLAAASGMTLVGFLRGSAMNVYAGAQRVES